jgi:hypothetical protein
VAGDRALHARDTETESHLWSDDSHDLRVATLDSNDAGKLNTKIGSVKDLNTFRGPGTSVVLR